MTIAGAMIGEIIVVGDVEVVMVITSVMPTITRVMVVAPIVVIVKSAVMSGRAIGDIELPRPESAVESRASASEEPAAPGCAAG